MISDQYLDTEPNGNVISTDKDGQPLDVTESSNFDGETTERVAPSVEFGEASFPSSEELRISRTSRSRSIWPGAASPKNGTADNGTNTNKKSNSCRLWTLLIAIVILVLLVITPAVVVSKNKNEESNQQSSSNDDESEAAKRPRPDYETIVEYVVGQGISLESDVMNLQTPQSKAIYWLMNEDPANVAVPISSDITTYEGYKYMARYIMAVNYFAFNGSSWPHQLNFLSALDICDWHEQVFIPPSPVLNVGVFCVAALADDRVTIQTVPYALQLLYFLDGTIPPENGKLTSLELLNLSGNSAVTGSIPTELCNISNLISLSLISNQLTGQIPSCMENLKEIKAIDIQDNLLTGNVPTSLCELPSLEVLFLSVNILKGEIPSCLGKITTLRKLSLTRNQFNGTIPVELCELSQLNGLYLSDNELVNEIPSCIGGFPNLVDLWLYDNLLSDEVPKDLANLSDTLKTLSLDNNMISGDPSDVFNKLINLEVLLASNNDFEITVDSKFLENSTSLRNLDMSHSNVKGPFPSHLFNFPLTILDLSGNQLTGSFSQEIKENPALEFLSVQGNNMTGQISSMVNLTVLHHLDLSENQFTGPIESIGELKWMVNLFLSENKFTPGPIPESFVNITFMQELSLRNTQRNGALSNPIGQQWMYLKLLDLGSNDLEGTIPESYGKLSNLLYLLLNDNHGINGTLPSQFGEMDQLLGVLLDGTSIDSEDAVALLCQLPNFANVTGLEKLIVDGTGECTKCAGCQYCDPSDTSGCSEPNLGNIDASWISRFRRPSDLYNFSTITIHGDRF